MIINNIFTYPDEVKLPQASNEIRQSDRVKLNAVESPVVLRISLIGLDDWDRFSPLSKRY